MTVASTAFTSQPSHRLAKPLLTALAATALAAVAPVASKSLCP